MLARGFLLLCISLPVIAQTTAAPPTTDTAKPLTYELVAIHKSKPNAQGYDLDDTPEGFVAKAINLRELLSEAYGFTFGELLKEQIEGLPGWGDSQRFDISAKVDVSNLEQLKAIRKAETRAAFIEAMVHHEPPPEMQMRQHLMEQYFHLKMHYEQRVMPVYALTVARGGLKMAAATPKDPEHSSMELNNGKFNGKNVPLDFIVFVLTRDVGRPVVNQTNLSGRYDFELNYAPDEKTSGDDPRPSIFTALTEQMGLKLLPSKAPVWIIVIDHVEMPVDN
jgi:uncharacterized protein (TIGR03435 family)